MNLLALPYAMEDLKILINALNKLYGALITCMGIKLNKSSLLALNAGYKQLF